MYSNIYNESSETNTHLTIHMYLSSTEVCGVRDRDAGRKRVSPDIQTLKGLCHCVRLSCQLKVKILV